MVAAAMAALTLSAHLLMAEDAGSWSLAAPADESDSGPVPICHGDCNGDGQVTIDDIIRLVGVTLGTLSEDCPGIAFPDIGSIIRAVDSALRGCLTYTYRLTEPSRIRYTPPPGASGQVVEEALAGTFSLVQVDTIDGVGSTRHIFTSFEFESSSFRAARTAPGELRSIGISIEGDVSTRIPVAINAEDVILQGEATLATFSCEDGTPLPCNTRSFNFTGLEICGAPGTTLPCDFCTMCEDIPAGRVGGYSVTIFAAPESWGVTASLEALTGGDGGDV